MIVSRRDAVIATRVSAETRAMLRALASSRGLSESALLARMVDAVLERNRPGDNAAEHEGGASIDRVTLRLRPGDRALVELRAAARGMKPSSYVVALVHAHVRAEAPLPAAELNALKAAVGQLSALTRTLREVASAAWHIDLRRAEAFEGEADFARHQLREIAVAIDGLRRSVGDLVRANLLSWESGDRVK